MSESELPPVNDADFAERFERAVRDDGRFEPEAFEFLQRGLELAARQRYGAEAETRPRHVTGRELCEALRLLAIQQWGPLAGEVLRRWNIHRTRDFGEMVYFMINLNLMGKQESDDIADFDNVYDFRAAFGSYEIPIDANVDDD